MTKKALSLLLCLALVFSMIPAQVFAEEQTPLTAEVTLTVSNQGIIAKDRDGLPMANRPVTVQDLDGSGTLTVDEALKAAHKSYLTEADYVGGSMVSKLWGVETSNTLFFVNNQGLTNGVGTDTVAQGDALTASINKDNKYYADWYTFFDAAEKTVAVNEEFTLKLQGHLGMAYTPEDKIDTPVNGVNIGTWQDGVFSALEGKKTDDAGNVTLAFPAAGTYYVTADGTVSTKVQDWGQGGALVNASVPIIAPVCVVTVQEPVVPVTALTVTLEDTPRMVDDTLIIDNGDRYQLKAVDQDGNETPVTWSCSSWMNDVELNAETGEFSIVGDPTSGGSSNYIFTATSVQNPEVSQELRFFAAGFRFSGWNKNRTSSLPENGKGGKSETISGGVDGHNIWTYDETAFQDFAELVSDPENGDAIAFHFFRPGTIEVSFRLDFDETLTDKATITVEGVAVEDSEGKREKTGLSFDAGVGSTGQLTAYCAPGCQTASWESSDETVVTVDETGKITAQNVGTAYVYAVDDQGRKGGIQVAVTSENTPYFESFEFQTSSFKWGQWKKGVTFKPLTKEYTLTTNSARTKELKILSGTVYNDAKFQATAVYTDITGTQQSVAVESGKDTIIKDIPFDTFDLVITVFDRENAESATVYTFHITRPRDTSDGFNGSSGIALSPEGRNLAEVSYQGAPEGTMFRTDEQGTPTGQTGFNGRFFYHTAYLLQGTRDFRMTVKRQSDYVHVRYAVGEAGQWQDLPADANQTDVIHIPDSLSETVRIQSISDAAYQENLNAGKDGFEGASKTYQFRINSVSVSSSDVNMRTASLSAGSWYPAFDPDVHTYNIVTNEEPQQITLTFTAGENITVRVGDTELHPAENGSYSTVWEGSRLNVTLASADGALTSSYQFDRLSRADKAPDEVVDYLCINSQYTNGGGWGGGFGTMPEVTLAGKLKSLGNFGGYVTYYYEDPIQNNPNNPYGVDFFVYGNANVENGGTGYGFFEPGQVWVSQDGEQWYALAGSEHYETDTIWDYTVTYRNNGGRTAWEDNYGHTQEDAAGTGAWVNQDKYPLHTFDGDTITLSGILLPAGDDGTMLGNSNSQACHVAWGYSDAFANGEMGLAVNPYQENSNMAKQKPMNGFDLAWAVDAEGNPVAVDDIHYIKVVTASNLWHGAFCEKSTEVSRVMRADALQEAVGKTKAPECIVVTDGAETKLIPLKEDQSVYTLDVGTMRYLSIGVRGAAADDNIYINNTRILPDEMYGGIKVTEQQGEKLVRMIVQNGQQEPVVCLVRLTGHASESDELLEDVKVHVNGVPCPVATTDGTVYTAEVGHRIEAVGILPVAGPDVICTINGAAPEASYALDYGENVFEIQGTSGDQTHDVILKVIRQDEPVPDPETITVTFTLYGDAEHGDNGECHIYSDGAEDLQLWIAPTTVEVPKNAVVLDVFEKALGDQYDYVNASGNYISSINGLAEFDNGFKSGWMYRINGIYASVGVAAQKIADGDEIVFHYTDDYTKEFSTDLRLERVIEMIGSIGEVTLKSETAITEARAAYEALTDAQKALVTNLDVLEAAEARLAELQKPVMPSFTDIAGHWGEKDILFAVEQGLFKGITDTEFGPEKRMTRGMFVTVLGRMAEIDENGSGKTPFADVPEDMYYAPYIAWAVENGIAKGMSVTEFEPEAEVTREQMAAFLARFCAFAKIELSGTADVKFRDADRIQAWAVNSVQAVTRAGLLIGDDLGNFNPRDFATRAEVATMLARFVRAFLSGD